MKKTFLFLIVGMSLFANASPSYAALFCAQVNGVPPECIYDDAAQCRRRALALGGVCMANATAFKKPIGYDAFCLVRDTRTVGVPLP